MKHKRHKILSLVLVVSLLIACLSGCTGGADDETTTQAQTQGSTSTTGSDDSTTQEVEELEYVELDWVVRIDASSKKDLDLIQAALDEYFLEKLNCKVNLIHLDNYGDVITTQLLSGEEMDLVYLIGQDYNGLSKQGVFHPMDELWEYGPNVQGMYSEDVWGSMTIDGHVYAVPTLRDNAYVMGVIYNNDLAADLGLDIEKDSQNWSSMKEVAEYAIEAIKLRDAKYPEYAGKPLMTAYKGPVPYYNAFEQIQGNLAGCNVPGLEADSSKGKDTVYNFYETEAYKEYVLTQMKLAQSGVIDFEAKPDRSPYTLFQNSWGYSWIKEDLYGQGYETKLKVFDTALWADTAAYTVACTGVAASSKNPERAMMVLDLLCSDPYLATLCRFGVEGTHWERDAEGNIQMSGRNADSKNRGWLSWYGIYHPNLHIAEAPESYGGPDGIMLEKLNEYVSESTVAAHMGFVFDTEPVANEIAACNNVIAEYAGLDTGAYNTEAATLEALDAFIAKLKANGSDKIVAEVQKQLDAWLAAK